MGRTPRPPRRGSVRGQRTGRRHRVGRPCTGRANTQSGHRSCRSGPSWSGHDDRTGPGGRIDPAGTRTIGAGADGLAIADLTPLSTCDWSGRLVATAFLQGCPWRCGYCHNPDLLDPGIAGRVPWARVRDLLRRRRGLIDAVVFAGGEPTRQAALACAVDEVRAAGFAVGLHTAGAYPSRLAGLLPQLDWVGLDIKALPEQYGAVTGVAAFGGAGVRGARAGGRLRCRPRSTGDHRSCRAHRPRHPSAHRAGAGACCGADHAAAASQAGRLGGTCAAGPVRPAGRRPAPCGGAVSGATETRSAHRRRRR